ncbi:hypothetical protein Z517_03101 [Fonsecaea pedrosoi CBS 271.37]|uniref:CENP-V/GFA domain-containing protein n=1 Tax=Fonsecaea pedrosoi CBS 271.37 TaxID=1442368 RepID=A0A0D2GZ19_9EURO|nr:uncharacterized protein Z517_03101 [Fonsecaea pedrosoi CBS 271.37]KIW83855.1 hypothetical protein Z517_03101 [Fonsecaea pedrosoi CBS 271.37]
MPSSGGCLYGKIRYSYEGEPLKICHKATSSAFSTGVFLLDAQFTLLSDPTVVQTYPYPQTSDASIQTLHFCPVCSTVVWRTGAADKYAGVLSVQFGTLDDPGVRDRLRPSVEHYVSMRTEWVSKIQSAEQEEGA